MFTLGMKYSSILIGDYITAKGNGQLTPLQVIKLTYIAHGYTLALLSGRPLIRDRIEAWKYGPVIPVLYDALKEYGGNPVPQLYYCGTMLDDTEHLENRITFFEKRIEPDLCRLIDKVLEMYGSISGPDLINLTHEFDTPWAQYYQEGVYGIEIPNMAIQKHYEDICGLGE